METVKDSPFIKNRVWSEVAVALIERKLSKLFDETIIVDSKDFWEKQLKYGSAGENVDYGKEDALKIAAEYGVIYLRANGEKGHYTYGGEITK